MRRWLVSTLLCLLTADLSTQYDDVAPRTTSPSTMSNPTTDVAPEPTQAELVRRADDIPPNICGWFSGSGYDVGWSYYDTSKTCYWNTNHRIVGDGSSLVTACFDNYNKEPRTRVLACTTPYQYCLTFSYTDPYNSDNYRAYMCTNTSALTWTMEPTWSGLTDIVRFPIYTGSSGISTGTQIPPGYSFSLPPPTAGSGAPPSASESSDSTAEGSTPTESSGDSTGASGSESSTAGSGGSSVPVGAIVGGVIGGLAVIGIAAVIIAFMFLRARRRGSGNRNYPESASPGEPEGQPPSEARQEPIEFVKPELDNEEPKPVATVQPPVPIQPAVSEYALPPPQQETIHYQRLQEPHSRDVYEAP